MTLRETLTFVAGLLFIEKRVSYNRLREELGLDDDTLELIRDELARASSVYQPLPTAAPAGT